MTSKARTTGSNSGDELEESPGGHGGNRGEERERTRRRRGGTSGENGTLGGPGARELGLYGGAASSHVGRRQRRCPPAGVRDEGEGTSPRWKGDASPPSDLDRVAKIRPAYRFAGG